MTQSELKIYPVGSEGPELALLREAVNSNGRRPSKIRGAVIPISQFSQLAPIPRVTKPASIEQISTRLRDELDVLSDRLGRAHEMLREEVRYWERGLKENQWDGYEACRRRLSRLKGALQYLGQPTGFYRKKVEPRRNT